MQSLPTIKPTINLNDPNSECQFHTWHLSVIADFLNHHRIPAKCVKLELGYDDENEFLFPQNPESKTTKWYTVPEAHDLNLAEQDYIRVTITLHTAMPADAWLSFKQKLFQELLLRCRDTQWPYLHADWNLNDPIPWDNWSEDELSCKHYSNLKVHYNIITLTWAPCWCS